jgi:hypothetical protein
MLFGCGGTLSWAPVCSFSAPNGKSEVRIEVKNCLADCDVQVLVKRGWHSDRIAWKSDCSVNFAHASWSGSRVGVFVDGGYCGPIKAAFDTELRHAIEFKMIKDELRNAIINSYRVTPEELLANEGDVFAWSTYPGDGKPRRSMEEFRKRYSQQ